MKKEYLDKETGIWSIEAAEKRHRFDEKLAQCIGSAYFPKLVADVGCGIGSYCKYFSEQLGWVVHGYEGTQNITSLGVYDNIMTVDLSVRRYIDINYDLVICLEVGEHIPKEYEQVFIDNIVDFTNKNLVLSWAVPKQGGFGHFNEQLNGYIVNEFEKRGLFLNLRMSDVFREHSSFKWFKNTILVFDTENPYG